MCAMVSWVPSLLEVPRADVRVDLKGAGAAARRERRPGRRLDQNPMNALGIRDRVRRGDQGVIRIVEAERETRDPGGQRLRAVAVPRVLGQGARRGGEG